MAAKTYPNAIELVLAHEGGFVNHPSDPGGVTNRGITMTVAQQYAAEIGWIKGRKLTINDMRSLPLWFAEKVYKAKYWDALNCDQLEPGVDYAVFDYGVNSGVGRSGRVLRRVLGLSDTNSAVTADVITAANKRNASWLAAAVCDERLSYLKGLKTWLTFGKGWSRRVSEVRSFSIKIAEDISVSVPVGVKLQPAPGIGIEPDKYARVRALQTELAAGGFYRSAIDGDLGPLTVKAFQASRGLKVDGIVGKITQPLLDAALAAIKVPGLVS